MRCGLLIDAFLKNEDAKHICPKDLKKALRIMFEMFPDKWLTEDDGKVVGEKLLKDSKYYKWLEEFLKD